MISSRPIFEQGFAYFGARVVESFYI